MSACRSPARESALARIEQTIATKDYCKRRAELQLPQVLDKPENDFVGKLGAVIVAAQNYRTYGCIRHDFAGFYKVREKAAVLEGRAFSDLVQTSVAKQLVRVYHGERNRRLWPWRISATDFDEDKCERGTNHQLSVQASWCWHYSASYTFRFHYKAC